MCSINEAVARWMPPCGPHMVRPGAWSGGCAERAVVLHCARAPCAHALCLCLRFAPQARTGIALLHREASGSTCDVRLKLTKEVLTIQKRDVVCVGGSSHGTHVSAPRRRAPRRRAGEAHSGRPLTASGLFAPVI